MIRKVEVVPHNPEWKTLYEMEAAKLVEVFGDELVSIHHVGSTSIPGISAKPIIDILPIVRDINRVEALNDAMAALGYIAKGEYGVPGRRLFIKPSEEIRTHNIHTLQAGDPEVDRMLDFRDYMTAHPEEAQIYAHLKEELAREFPTDITSYLAGKTPFIQAAIVKGREWRRSNR